MNSPVAKWKPKFEPEANNTAKYKKTPTLYKNHYTRKAAITEEQEKKTKRKVSDSISLSLSHKHFTSRKARSDRKVTKFTAETSNHFTRLQSNLSSSISNNVKCVESPESDFSL